jgi:hypothetical protein
MADQAEWFGAFVERSLQEVFQSPEVVQDGEGDYPFGREDSPSYITVDSGSRLGVCVWSYAAHNVKGSVRVLREINDLNMASWLCKAIWHDGAIRVELRLPADQVSVESLDRACGHVQGMTADIGEMFAVVHGGAIVASESQAS